MTFSDNFRINQKTVILLIFIIILASFTRIISFSGYAGSDDGAYAELARQMANGDFKISQYSGPRVFPFRIGLLAPTALGFKMAGHNELVMIVYPFVLSMLSVVLVFLVGRTLFNVRVGLIAAAIQALLPIDTRSASMLLPDLPAAFWAGLGILLLFYGANRTTPRSKTAYGIFSGLAFSLSWMCKASVLYLFPFIGIYMIWLIYRQKQNLALLAGVGLMVVTVLLVELLVYYKYTLDPLYRFHEIERNYEVSKTWFFTQGSKFGWTEGGYCLALLRRIFKTGPMTILFNRNFGLVTGVAALALIYAVFRRLRSFVLPGIWFLSLAFMFNFMSSSLQSYRPLVLFDRYLYLLIFPSVVLTAGLIDVLIPVRDSMQQEINRERLFWGTILVIGIVFICLRGIYKNVQKGMQSPVERKISQMLGPKDPIYTDSRTASVLKFFWKYPEETRTWNFEDFKINDVSTKAYVLINRNRLDFLNSTYNYVLPKFYDDIPADWSLEWSGNRAELYWVPAETKTVF